MTGRNAEYRAFRPLMVPVQPEFAEKLREEGLTTNGPVHMRIDRYGELVITELKGGTRYEELLDLLRWVVDGFWPEGTRGYLRLVRDFWNDASREDIERESRLVELIGPEQWEDTAPNDGSEGE